MISLNTDYQLSFDAKIIGTPGWPLFQIHYYTDPIGTNPPGQIPYDLSNPGSFSASHPAANGFTEYVINLRFSSSNPAPPLYLELDFWTDFYASSSSQLYLDNMQLTVVPEPTSAGLLLIGCAPIMLRAARKKHPRPSVSIRG